MEPLINDKILLIARNRGFWASEVSRKSFPRRVILSANAGKPEQLLGAFRAFIYIFLEKPKIILLGTSTTIVTVFVALRRLGMFKKTKLVTDKQYLREADVKYLDKVIVYSPNEIKQYSEIVRNKFVFLHYPSKLELVDSKIQNNSSEEKYIFTSGNNARDYKSFFNAIKGIDIKVIVVADSLSGIDIPNNCEVYPFLPLNKYVELINNSLFVVVPLNKSDKPHGHYVISTALSLGKPVITTKEASVDEYVIDGVNGILVQHADVSGYKESILRLLSDTSFFEELLAYTKAHMKDFSYESFSNKLKEICHSL